jgi:hypothetical protein
MATQIRRNPELTGEDAERFLRLMEEVKKGNAPAKQKRIARESFERGRELSKKFSFFGYSNCT